MFLSNGAGQLQNGAPERLNPIAQVMLARSQQIRLRVALPIIIAPIFQAFTGWKLAVAWVAAYAALQLLETRLFPPAEIATRLSSRASQRAALALVVVNGVVFGGFGLAEAVSGGAWGTACGVLLLSGAMMNAVLTSSGSRAVFLAAMAPQVFYFVALPFVVYPAGAPLMNVLGLAVAATLNIVVSTMAWGLSERVLAAEQAARREAEKAVAAKSAFVAMVSHELRTPISAILAGASELDKVSDAPAVRASGALILDSARMMRALLNDLLDLSKMEAGRLATETIPFDLGALVDDTVRFWSAEASKKGLSVSLARDDASGGWAAGDPLRLRQILNNLFSNAIKFTDAGGVELRITCTGSDADRRLAFAVADTGPGMTPDQLERLFTPFEQADVTVARTHGGTGLGLAISRQLAQMMGGDLIAASQLGKGATFTLALPLPAASPQSAPEKDQGPPLDRGLRVLIADDHEVNRQAFGLMLAPVCDAVVAVTNGQEALDRLSVESFDLVFMDLNMPVLNGPDAVRRLRAGGGPNARVPVIALTGATGGADQMECEAAGMNGFVVKPVEPAELFAAIEAALSSDVETGQPLRASA